MLRNSEESTVRRKRMKASGVIAKEGIYTPIPHIIPTKCLCNARFENALTCIQLNNEHQRFSGLGHDLLWLLISNLIFKKSSLTQCIRMQNVSIIIGMNQRFLMRLHALLVSLLENLIKKPLNPCLTAMCDRPA